MRKIDLTPSALSALFDAIPDGALTDELRALKDETAEQLEKAAAKQALADAETKLAENVTRYREKHLESLDIPDAVDFIGMDFELDLKSGKFVPTGNVRAQYAGGSASEEMQQLCAALDKLDLPASERPSVIYAIESSITMDRFNQVVGQSQIDLQSVVRAVVTKAHSQHFTNGVDIPSDVKKGNIEIVYNSKSFAPEAASAGWATLRCKLGNNRRTTGTRSGGTRTVVAGFKSNREYLESIADDKLKALLEKHDNDWTKINATQHIKRIESAMDDDADKIYMKAKGLL